MSELDVTLENSRVWYDRDGACWLLLHVPEGVDTGEMCSTLWAEYCKYLERAYASLSGSNVLGAGESSGRDGVAVPEVSGPTY